MASYDRTVEDLGNIVGMEHVNTRVPDQRLATLFYVTGLGLTRDPFLMTGVTNMWINVGRSQFHLPSGNPQVVRGHTGVVIPDLEALAARLEQVKEPLAGTGFSFKPGKDRIDTTCPWGNRISCFAAGAAFGQMQLGIPYVAFDVPIGTAEGIVRFYEKVLHAPARVGESDGRKAARVQAGPDQELHFVETDAEQPAFDGHHIAIYIADFSGPYKALLAKGMVSEESDQHQYRFKDIFDPDTGRVLYTIEHEVRSMRHPLYARPMINRNPAQSNRAFAPGHEEQAWSLPVA